VRVYSATVGRHVNVAWGGLPYRAREVIQPWTRYEVLPGWQARTALVDGIVRMEQDKKVCGLLLEPGP